MRRVMRGFNFSLGVAGVTAGANPATSGGDKNTSSVAHSVTLPGRSRCEHDTTPGDPLRPANADCIGRSVYGSNAQIHDTKNFINLASLIRQFQHRYHGK